MKYFKRIDIPEFNSKRIESKIREFSLKRNTSLDFKSAISDTSGNKEVFLAFENDHKIDLLRVITSFERLLPKIIVTFEKNNFNQYRVRMKLITTIVMVLLLIGLIIGLIASIIRGEFDRDLSNIIIVNTLFYALLYIELIINKRRIDSILNKN